MSVQVSSQQLQEFLDFAVEVAKKAGEMIKDGFSKKKNVETKQSNADLVTETDQAVEKWVIGYINERYPSHKFIGEETTDGDVPCDFTDDLTWIVDPIDGTTNFVHSIPEVSYSMGLTANKEVIVGVVYIPVLDLMYTSMKGHGSYCNGRKLAVSSVEDLKQSIVIHEGGSSRVPAVVDTKMKNIHSIVNHSHGIRAYGSAAINFCRVADGQGEAYVEYGIHCWDFAAGMLIAEEAGAYVMDPDGGPCDLMKRRVLVACGEKVARELSAILTHLDMGRD
ncbi:inositol monophosphatase 1-like [Haliotis cracherodii]|uniref:inositol monophosphatase 1-like n=1 Tax=Haliotis cracherodii TaxID=6455 RepID=UPI0039EC5303